MAKRFRPFTPTHWIYVLLHAILIVGGFACWIEGSTISRAIGSSLIAAGITGTVVFVYLLFSQQNMQITDLLIKFGFIGAFDGRATRIRPEYESRLDRAKNAIDIMGFGLQALRQDHRKNFPVWKSRAHVRILLIDPEFPEPGMSYAKQRDSEEGNPLARTESDVRQFIHESASVVESGKFEIRLYRCLPSVNLFRIDNDVLWGPYFVREQSRNLPTFVVSGGLMFEHLMNHFERIWTDDSLSRPVPDGWWTQTDESHRLSAAPHDVD